MTDSQRNYKSTEDEIDLKQLFTAIGEFFKNIWLSFVKMVARIRRATIRNWLLFAVLSTISGIVGYTYSNYSDDIYNSSMLLSSDYFNGRLIDNAIEELNLLCQEEDRKELAKQLNIKQSVAMNISGFEAEPFITEQEKVDLEILKQKLTELSLEESEINSIVNKIDIENKHAFQISIYVTKSDIIEGLEPAIMGYFKSNPYISNRIVGRQNRLNDRLIKLQKEEKKIDSLKGAMIQAYQSISNKTEKGSDNLYIGDQYSSSPIEVFEQDLEINNQILGLKEALFLRKDFELIDGLTVFKKPVSASPLKSALYGVLIGIGLTYLIIALRAINSYLSKIDIS